MSVNSEAPRRIRRLTKLTRTSGDICGATSESLRGFPSLSIRDVSFFVMGYRIPQNGVEFPYFNCYKHQQGVGGELKLSPHSSRFFFLKLRLYSSE